MACGLRPSRDTVISANETVMRLASRVRLPWMQQQASRLERFFANHDAVAEGGQIRAGYFSLIKF